MFTYIAPQVKSHGRSLRHMQLPTLGKASHPVDDYIARQGPAFLAHLLRRLSDELIHGAAVWYPTTGVTAPPRTISTLIALDDLGPLGVTELSTLLRQSHPLVITWIKELTSLSFVAAKGDRKDRRRSVVTLTAKGKTEVRRVRAALVVMEQASMRLLDQGGKGLLAALWRMEGACRDMPFAEQLRRLPERRRRD
jgi:DNA-binding MarR family transcriptional regulator